MNDEELIKQANADFKEERLLVAARLLKQVKNQDLLGEKEKWMLEMAEHFEQLVIELKNEPGSEWKKQGESHGKYDTIIYYKVVDYKLTVRIETPIPQDLLVPIMSVFNEVELYSTWMPRYEFPFKVGLRDNKVLKVENRFNKLIWNSVDMPPPLAHREVILDAIAIDDIDENGCVICRFDTAPNDHPDVPPPETPKTVRMTQSGQILFRKCPSDHPVFAKSKNKGDEQRKDMVLVTVTTYVDAHVSFVPKSLINFITRTFIGKLWANNLQVAEEIRDGIRTEHAKSIADQKQVYEWMAGRVECMLSGFSSSESEN